ncbi:hypothetical protein BBJ29_005889 [Phytophthora kernoviae]|uniref:Major facilitator superfamily (MFS) profile domain-containing protein n=1 Tax=Phytophthora kernoviae TaxID=325452 RepID=A0A3F2RPH6_9STRA|nr:hypothetical protein BBP00_00005768 [Phytophthora kernoviae]RLN69551.1 hypothetical protein BBJ29_005889 [Phytophthora kernoviae]
MQHAVDDVDKSAASIMNTGGDTYDTMMQLSEPLDIFQRTKIRSLTIWLITSCILFLTNQLTTLPVGFYPSYVAKRGIMSPAELSVFFSVYPLCIMFSSPLAASVSSIVGRQTLICLGLMLSGSSTIAFAYATGASSAFLLRIFQGLGSGAAVVGSFSMISEEFSSHIGQILAIQEFIVAAAFVTAPPLGSYLYETQGYEMPFLMSGVAQIVVVIVVPFIFIEYSLPDGVYSQKTRPAASALYRSPSFNLVRYRDVLTPTCKVCLTVTTFAMLSFGFMDPYLGSHLHKVLGAEHIAVGLGFALSAFVYFLGGLVYAWLSRACGSKQVILLGLAMLSVGFFFLGPTPLLNGLFQNTNRLWFAQYVSLTMTGCGAALAIAPGLPLTIASVQDKGTHGSNLVIGLFAAAIYLGQALGPFLSFVLMQVLPTTHSLNCIASELDPTSTVVSCDSSLPWAFAVYSLLTLALVVLVAGQLPTSEATAELLRQKHKRVPLMRQPSEYGQFVCFDEDGDEEDCGCEDF